MSFRRNEFTKATKRAAFDRAGGICECHLIPHVFPQPCGLSLGEGNTWYEHIDPDRISGRNDLANCAVLTKTCGRIKSAVYDARIIARVRRREDAARAIKNAPSIPGNRLESSQAQAKRDGGRPPHGRAVEIKFHAAALKLRHDKYD